MKTIRLEEPGRLALLSTVAEAVLQPDEALVRVHRIGVCGTDIHAFRGKQPFFSYQRTLGHELGVAVLEVGVDVKNVKAGDNCSVEAYLNCRKCIACLNGKSNCCTGTQVLEVQADGGMRAHLILPACMLHPSSVLTLDEP